MASQGSVIARVYTSDAYLPLMDVPVIFTQILPDGSTSLLAVLRTNASGLTPPLFVPTPDVSDSLIPGALLQPYATVNIQAELPGYGRILSESVQIFPGVETIQGLQLRPLPPFSIEEGETVFPGSSQNL